MHFQDETLVGLITQTGRLIAPRGVKPIGQKQHIRQCFYIYGTVSPSGEGGFFVELPEMTAECFQIFLDEFSRYHRIGLHLIVVDRARIHFAKVLKIPKNVVLIPLPAASPELNPIERVWLELKRALKWQCFNDLDALSDRIWEIVSKWDAHWLRSLTHYPYLRNCIG